MITNSGVYKISDVLDDVPEAVLRELVKTVEMTETELEELHTGHVAIANATGKTCLSFAEFKDVALLPSYEPAIPTYTPSDPCKVPQAFMLHKCKVVVLNDMLCILA